MATTHALGIDIGGTGIKGAPVDLRTGQLTAERLRILTPQPSTPDAVAGVLQQLVEHFAWQGPIGITFPAVVQNGVIRTAANVDHAWIDLDADAFFDKALGADTHVVNDADAAGAAEVKFGAAKGKKGVVMLITLGTGIGSALFVDGQLVPNTELGHLEIDGQDAEKKASEIARENEDMSWEKWGTKRLTRYFQVVENLFWPDLFVVGGGVSKKSDKFLPFVDIRTPIVPATLFNEAGIVGAAMLAAKEVDLNHGAGGPARKTPAKKTTATKTPAKKTAATKTTATKTTPTAAAANKVAAPRTRKTGTPAPAAKRLGSSTPTG